MATRRSEDKPRPRTSAASPATSAPAPARRPPRARGATARTAAPPALQASPVPPAPSSRARAAPSTAAEPLPPCAPTAEESAKAESFWRAGLRALDNVRHDVQRRQASVIETLLGIPPTAAAGAEPRLGLPALPGLDAFGLRKFEDVFDQRVAAALERLGMPTREEMRALHDKLDRVLAQLERLGAAAEAEAAAPIAAPVRPAPRRAKPVQASPGSARARKPR